LEENHLARWLPASPVLLDEPQPDGARRLAAIERPGSPENALPCGVIPALRGCQNSENKDGRPESDHPVKDSCCERCAGALGDGIVRRLVAGGEPITPRSESLPK
jgi:hypothetical protein